MNGGIIVEAELINNINYIQYYADEEKKSLTNIYNTLKEGCNSYKSTNTGELLSSISQLKEITDKIYTKREKYIEILNKVILQYHNLSNLTVNRFNGDV